MIASEMLGVIRRKILSQLGHLRVWRTKPGSSDSVLTKLMVVPHCEQVGRQAIDIGVLPLISLPLAEVCFLYRGCNLVSFRFHLGPLHRFAAIRQLDNHFVVTNGNDHVAFVAVGISTDPDLPPTLRLHHGLAPLPREGVRKVCDDQLRRLRDSLAARKPLNGISP